MEYILIIVWVGVMAYVAGNSRYKKAVLVDGVEEQRYTFAFAFVVFLPIFIVAGCRQSFVDTNAYVAEYINKMPSTLSQLPEYISAKHKDTAFYAFSAVLRIVFQGNRFLYLFTLALLQGLAVANLYRKYSTDFMMSVFLFVASADYLSWMFNGIRQFTAVTIIICATSLMLRKKYIPLIIMIIFASLFHQSALLMIPIVFITQGKAWNKLTIITILALIVAIAFIGQFTEFLDDILVDTQYENVVSDYQTYGWLGTNVFRVLVYCVPAVISFIGRNKIRESNNRLINLCTNMSIISACLYVLSAFTSGIFLGRLPIYVSLYGYILLPWELNNLFNDNDRKIFKIVMVISYLVFYYIQIHGVWSLI